MAETTSSRRGRISFDSFWDNFLGNAPEWYKRAIVGFLILNPLLLLLPQGHYIAGWAVVLEFIFTLAMALKCYPLQPGGLLAFEAIVFQLSSPDTVMHELVNAFPVILLLIFMVAGIYFMKDLLLFIFTKILLRVRSKALLSFLFCFVAAFLSAFLDALTVTAVVISVAVGFYSVYHRFASESGDHDEDVPELHRQDLDQFRSFLRGLVMHAAVGTALGGVTTTVGEPQNLLISEVMKWEFIEFFMVMAPVTLPVLAIGLFTCLVLEWTGWFGYGTKIPENVLAVLKEYDREETAERTGRDNASLIMQAVAALFLICALAFQLAAVGLVGLSVIVLQTALNGIVEEHQIGHAFEEALPFTALLAVFFTVVAVIHDQHLFTPVIDYVLSFEPHLQPGVFYIANGVLSAISDNVFVATVYINEVKEAYVAGDLMPGADESLRRQQFDLLAVAINTGTNIPSGATPNGQAAFLFLLTSSLAPLIRLSYGRMVFMALPYTLTMGITGWMAVQWILQ